MKFESSSAISKGLGNALEVISEVGSLPFIRGTWYYVDPEKGSDTADGRTIDTAVQTIRSAYDKCLTSVGDGICLLAYPSTTTADTTAYLGGTLTWAKHGITVVGVASKQGFDCRARIASIDRAYTYASTCSWTTLVLTDTAATFIDDGFQVGDGILVTVDTGTAITSMRTLTAVTQTTLTWTGAITANSTTTAGIISTHCRPLINVTGRGNSFINIGFIQNGDTATDDGAMLVSADYNYYENCYFNMTNATATAQTTAYCLTVNSSENVFKHCFFGSNSTAWAAANALIRLGVSTQQIGQDYFEDCYITSNSTTAGHMAVAITNAATLGGWVLFRGCSFVNWYSGAATALTAAIGGTDTDNMGILLQKCAMVGWAIWVDAGWDNVYTDVPASAATGGVAVVTG